MSAGESTRARESNPWVIDRPWEGHEALAQPEGLTIRALRAPVDVQRLRDRRPTSRLGRLFPTLRPVLEESRALLESGGHILIPYDSVEILDSMGIDAFDDLVPWAPFALYIEGQQYLGSDAFRYRFGFFLGRERVALERRGWFVRRGDQIYRLDSQTFRTVEAMDEWNAGGEHAGGALECLRSFAKVKGLARGVGAQLDSHLQSQNVIVPPKVGVDLVRETDGRISFVPRIRDVPESSFREDFLRAASPDGPYSVSDDNGQHYQVIFDDDLKEVVRRIWRVRHVGGSEASEILAKPASVFDGVLSHVDTDLSSPDLDLTLYSERVIGRGPLPMEPTRKPARTGVLDGDEVVIPFSFVDENGTPRAVETSLAELKELREDLNDAEAKGSPSVPFCGTFARIDATLKDAVEKVVGPSRPGNVVDREPPDRIGSSLGLQIKPNLAEVEYEDGSRQPIPIDTEFGLPKALAQPDLLKAHQKEGFSWLFGTLRRGRAGCLLADDMGLGKTLQVLTFLAAAIERDTALDRSGRPDYRLIAAGQDSEAPPWNPILIVAPVILLENQTWQSDMRRFFDGEGSVFLPWVDLRGPELKRLRRTAASGMEIRTGESHLDVERLREYRVVLTNYETVVNYQFSLAQVPWSIVITDEAQEFKTPSTRVAHAIKALKSRFRVAATGTPVETSLEDVWSLFDFLEPSRDLLGSLEEFRKTWANPVSAELAEGRVANLEPLRQKLGVGPPHGRILRREKTDHVSLPPKTEIVLECDLSDEQVQQHSVVFARARAGGKENHPLSLIHHLLLLTQHPLLHPTYSGAAPEALVSSCPKLARVLDELERIRGQREKALVFTRSIPMQQILHEVFLWRFGCDAGIINGRGGRTGEPSSSRNVRRETLDRFRRREGFDILILSPEVAGLGLTIVEANHVFHYGRWWNPAKELQATDRAYRIGQEKEVFVYYPVARDPRGRFRSFDQSLHELLARRKELAKEFLRPGADDGQLGDELARELLGGASPQATPLPTLKEADLGRMDGYGFEALVSAMERKRGHKTILTPTAGDEGVDVLALQQQVLWLFQCKHNASGSPVDREALDELRRGFEGWSARRLSAARGLTIRLCLVTSGPVTGRLRREAQADGIDVRDGRVVRSLLEQLGVTEADCQEAGAGRAPTMRNVQDELASLLRRAEA